MELFRSLIFVPGNRRDMLEKAVSFPADIVVPDMEDSVPMSEKTAARDTIGDMLPILSQAGRRVMVRVNALSTGLLEEDMRAAITPHTYAVNVGKIETPWDVSQVDAIMASAEARVGLARGSVRMVPYIETALGLVNAYAVCSASPPDSGRRVRRGGLHRGHGHAAHGRGRGGAHAQGRGGHRRQSRRHCGARRRLRKLPR